MNGRIPQHFIDELLQRADIVEIIGSRVPLKKAGREYKACCPFHGEKTPSFTVSPTKGFYHCFGCGAHGTALGFLMEYDRLEFIAAVEELATRLGLEVPREGAGQAQSPLAPVYDALAAAAAFFEKSLRTHPSAVDYLRSRGLDGETARTFRVGYAPPAWDSLLREFEDTDAERTRLAAAGLIVAREGGGYYDRFRDRIMFPIRDSRGRVIGFGGRVIGSGEPKYLNSPETAVFHKGQELYGLYEARQAERRLTRLLVVEGYMDVVSLGQHGICDAVATLGTATTPDQVRRLFRAVPEIVFCFDGDRAGRAAAWRALQASLPEVREGRQVRFLFLPDGEDPDSLVRKEGAKAFATRADAAVPLSDYLLEELQRQVGSDSLDARARLAELARPLVAMLPPGVYRELLTDRLSEAVGLRRERLTAALGTPSGSNAPAPARRPRPVPGQRPSLVRQAITLLVHHPELGRTVTVPPGLDTVRTRGTALLAELLELTRSTPGLTPGALVERFRERPEGPHLAELLAGQVLVGEAGAARELADSLQRIVAQARDERLAELVSKAASASLSTEEKDEFRRLQKEAAGIR
ncbi:MAG: DNA primase [Gammaproteobacteria bacterium]|nr:DNA primase [Gammaproteobacteria bacterium]